MSDDPEREVKQSSAGESESASGFRLFWKKQDKNAGPQTVQFVPQDPGSKRSKFVSPICGVRDIVGTKHRAEPHRLSRLLRQGSSPLSNAGSLTEDSENSNPGAAQKRREQVYQAQKCVARDVIGDQQLY